MVSFAKRWLCFFIILLFSANQSAAQSTVYPGDEMHAGYGVVSDIELFADISSLFKIIFNGFTGELTKTENRMTGPFVGGYTFYVNDAISLGPELNIVNLEILDWYSSGERAWKKFLLLNMSGKGDIHFIRKNKLDLYSGLALGGSYIFYSTNYPTDEDKSGPFISYQLNLLGVRYGIKWAGYAEFGFGRNGLFSFGISKKF